MFFVQLIVGLVCAAGSLILLVLIVTSELNYKDLTFITYFGILCMLAAITFFVVLRNPDNEETNPGKEKPRR